MPLSRFLLGIIVALLSRSLHAAPVQSDRELTRLLVGTWVEVFDAQTSSTHTFGSDGGYWSTGNPSNAQLPRILVEGTWTIEKGILRYTITACSDTRIAPADLSCNDEILELSRQEMRYRATVDLRRTFGMKRQAENPKAPYIVRGKIVGGWAFDYKSDEGQLSKEVLFHPVGLYTEKGTLRIPDGASYTERKYELMGRWRFRDKVLVVDVEHSTAPPYPAGSLLCAEIVALDDRTLVLHPADCRSPVTARPTEVDPASPDASPASVTTPQTAGRLFGIPLAAPLSAPQAKIVHERVLPEKVTAVAIGIVGKEVFAAHPELDPEGIPGLRGRTHGGALGDQFLFSSWNVSFHREKAVEIEFSGLGDGVTVPDLVYSFDWLFKTLGDATQFFTNDLNLGQPGAELIGAAWATPQALVVLSYHVGHPGLYPKLTVYDPSRTLSDVRTTKNMRYLPGDHASCRPIYRAWAKDIAKLTE